LKSERGFSDTQIGTLNAVYSPPNVVMVLIGGMLVDRIGASRSIALFAFVCALGSLLTAVASSFGAMVVGRLVFGLGAESLIVGVTTALGHWFGGKRLGLMLGLNLSIARGGSYAADLSPTWARSVYASGVRSALLLAAGFALVSLVAAVAAFLLDRARSERPASTTSSEAPRFAWSDALRFDRSYWYLVGLCVAIYSVLFPFRSTFAIEYYQHAHGLTREAAGALNGWVFLAAIVATPLFGWLFDRADAARARCSADRCSSCPCSRSSRGRAGIRGSRTCCSGSRSRSCPRCSGRASRCSSTPGASAPPTA
jgi:MFS family permease